MEKVRKSPSLPLKRSETWGLKVPRELRCLSASTPRSISFLEITPISEEIILKVFKYRERAYRLVTDYFTGRKEISKI
jgi:hypothetical protein